MLVRVRSSRGASNVTDAVRAFSAFRPYLLVGSVNRSNSVASCLVSSRLENFSANFGWIATLVRERAS